MAEYIEREALLKDISETVLFSVRGGAKLPTPEMRGANKVIDRIKSVLTADVVKVVRCKGCKYFIKGGETSSFCKYHTDNASYCDECCWVTENDFCSYGEKMDGKGEGE